MILTSSGSIRSIWILVFQLVISTGGFCPLSVQCLYYLLLLYFCLRTSHSPTQDDLRSLDKLIRLSSSLLRSQFLLFPFPRLFPIRHDEYQVGGIRASQQTGRLRHKRIGFHLTANLFSFGTNSLIQKVLNACRALTLLQIFFYRHLFCFGLLLLLLFSLSFQTDLFEIVEIVIYLCM